MRGRGWAITGGLALLLAWTLTPRYGPLQPDPRLPTFQRIGGGPMIDGPPPEPHSDVRPCDFPSVPTGAQVIVLSARAGQGVPDMTLASQDEAITTAAIQIEAGDAPLYIVAFSQSPMIWRLEGATGRVTHLVLAERNRRLGETGNDGMPLAAAAGLPEDKVSFLAHHNCMPMVPDDRKAYADALGAIVQDATGKTPALVLHRDSVSAFQAPSGGATVHTGAGGWSALLRRIGIGGGPPADPDNVAAQVRITAPDGVIALERRRIVARDPVEPYRIFPSYTGLSQLVAQGVLEDKGHNNFTIHKPMHFPAGLDRRADIPFFLLKRGVPPPQGDPGEACILDEATRTPLNRRCI